ncbi:aldehyde dehydrogenase (NADP(+)) [Sphingomonas ursincola]|uniref:2,5-dioxovalerate dehydrogenase n=1 Tax=Sphingomonas ursincola TaxID=56361 RepID=A0A7V8RDN5_9SPHN|nr:aldehyde dehydrogenase (NADP(+)) [Sphingomonas ursincola]MBA1374489.1 aldehyde dehydrogenase (NADP(+)) [Sphingomonas ursincola]
MTLTGQYFIAGERRGHGEIFHAYDPARGASITDIGFFSSDERDIADACAAAEDAAVSYADLPLERRAAFLEAIASEIEGLGDALLSRAAAESGLPLARLTGERGRTCGQLRLFAAEVRDGQWLKLRIDHADPARTPPKPDLRLRMIPLGPVAVFGASNFPLAFSTAGGDTASALAAGCPVVVKGHPAHPGTAELVAGAITRAAAATGMPAGVFSMVTGTGNAIGAALVADPRIQAVGFTGSRSGGEALMKIAAARPQPIPVYAEMSAINPVILLPHALASRGKALAAGYVGSLTLGSGQFCTNPGLALALEGAALDAFLTEAGALVEAQVPQTMLTAGIHSAYEKGSAALAATPEVQTIARGVHPTGPHEGRTALFSVAAKDWLAKVELQHEVFGTSSIVVRCADRHELLAVLRGLEGQLTATLHMDEADTDVARALLPVLERKVGRILANGWPTGVEVGHAINHGGPYPATSDGRTTSVGTLAIDRFLRPVAYQDLPEALLPEALREGGQGGVIARIDGAWRLA